MAARKKTTKTAQATGFENIAGLNGDTFKEGFEKINQGIEQVAEFQKESLEAVIAASTLVSQKVEKLNAEQTAFAKNSVEEGVNAVKALSSCKNPQEAFDLNSEFLRSAFESNMAQFNKMTEMVLTASKEAAEPLTANYNQFVETVQSYRP